MRLATCLALLACCLAVAACGERAPEEEGAAAEETAQEVASESPGARATLGPISDDLQSKPEVPRPSGEPPAELQTRDIVVGDGPAAKAGDAVQMQYVGVSWSTGEQFDASWDSGQPFTFTLGAGGVIRGWDEGIVGMRPGGRRLLVIPPELGYGETGAGAGAIAPNETLVFVVDLERIQ
jgi:peptidylprolyl isomerase